MLRERSFAFRVGGIAASVAIAAAASRAAAQPSGVIHVDTVDAPSLRRNLLGDPDRRAASVYLPPGYSKRPYRRYPVLYLLHGFAANDRAFIRGAYQNLNIRVSMDSLVNAGAVHEMIIVTPSARNAYDGSFYANSPVTGRWEDFVVRDLVTHMDSKYRTIRSRGGRGIAGHSMGGYGALRIAMRHPSRFSAVYALSAYGLGMADSLTEADKRAWRSALLVAQRSEFLAAGFHANLLLAQAALYSPDTAHAPLYVRIPYRLDGDSLIADVTLRQRWTAATPLAMVNKHAPALRRLKVGFDAGDADGFPDIPRNARALDSLLTTLRIRHDFEIYSGTHGSRIRQRLEQKVLPFFSRHFARRMR